jgi:malate synthase
MPRQAVALKKYRCGTSPVSKMSDNEDATAPLWYSKVLSVKNSVSEPIPELPQDSEEGSKRPSVVNRQDAGDVLPYQPSGPQALSKSSELKGEVATRIIQSCSESGD